MTSISDLSIDQQLLYRAADAGRAADRWWMAAAPWWRRALLDRRNELCAWAREVKRMRVTLDELVENERQNAELAERRVSVAGLEALVELDLIVQQRAVGGGGEVG